MDIFVYNQVSGKKFPAKIPLCENFEELKDVLPILDASKDMYEIDPDTVLPICDQDTVYIIPNAKATLTFLNISITSKSFLESINVSHIELLLKAGINIDVRNRNNKTALMLACENGHTDIVKFLLDAGASITSTDEGYRTALMIASMYGHVDSAKLLLDAGSSVHAQTHRNVTVLMIASINGFVNSAKLLLDAGASKNAQNEHGETACDLALKHGHRGVAKFIKNYQYK